jgi:serine O-acetyltransferase
MSIFNEIADDFRFYRELRTGRGFFAVLFDRSYLVCANYRYGHWASRVRAPLIGKLLRFAYIMSNVFVSAITGTEIRSAAVLGKRPDFHTTFGLIIADGAVIGDDCTFNSGVCIVNKANGRGEGQPTIGDHVVFGVGCKVLGGITVGDHAVIGANAVVLHDVPAHHIAFGMPARNKPLATLKEKDGRNTETDLFGLKVLR